MTLLKPCVECGELSERARCEEHRPKDLQASSTARGYDQAWRRLSERARRMQPFCSDCQTTDDLTVDHSPEAWAARDRGDRITLDLVDVVCRSCNGKRGRARPTGDGGTSLGSRPLGKAKFRSDTQGGIR